jgi:TonB family protein
MKAVTPLVVNLLLNSFWQVAAIALIAGLADYLVRPVARLRHFVWVAALLMSFALPSISYLASQQTRAVSPSPSTVVEEPAFVLPAPVPESVVPTTATASSFRLSETMALILIAAYLLFILYRLTRLFRAGIRTMAAARTAARADVDDALRLVIENCQRTFRVSKVAVMCSPSLEAPATLGIFKPRLILPESLLRDHDVEALTAAVGHELVHIKRRDYLLNLIYEFIFLPLSFHPAACLIKRRITQTRELRCDELVAERLLHPDVYARSLVRLAGWALPCNRRAETVIIGIADAEILEVRIMSLLKKTKSNLRRNVLMGIAACALLAIPCAAAAAFHFKFDIESPAIVQSPEPSSQAQEKKEVRTPEQRERFERELAEVKARMDREDRELKERIEQESDPAVKAKLLAELRRRQEEEKANVVYAITADGDRKVMFEVGQRREIEAKQRAELARQAKISMDQAIQIATSQVPGKVLECTLVGEHWSEPGELAKPATVLYHVVILSGDETNPTATHVLVNAVDGTLVKTEKEERRPENFEYLLRTRRERTDGGSLNGRAIRLPNPEYPEVAKAAHASGEVKVEVTVDEQGNVIAAKAVAGHPLLQAAAVSAAREAKFEPTRSESGPVKVNGVLVYRFETH